MADAADTGLKVSKVFFEPKEILFSPGDAPAGLFFIEDGTVEVFREAGHRTVTLARLGRGDVVGELAMVEGIPHTRGVRAVTGVAALRISPDQLDAALKQSPPLVQMVLKRVVRKLHRTNELAFGPSRPSA
ncbi:MAG: cyclic nucleotide-binding domain-containing protein [Thalassobaculaceae bacterium]